MQPSTSTQFVEYFLHGSILAASKDVLLARLKGLCEPNGEEFNEHELVFCQRIPGVTGQPTFLKVRRAMDVGNSDIPWHLRYVGNPEPDLTGQRPTLMRKTVDSLVKSDNLMLFLRGMGFRVEYEFVAKGYIFTKGKIKVLVYEVCKLIELANPSKGTEPFTKSLLVEVSVVSPFGQDSIAIDIKQFADQLRPLVILEKHDYSKSSRR